MPLRLFRRPGCKVNGERTDLRINKVTGERADLRMNRVHAEKTNSRPRSLSAPSIPSGCGANGERADLGISKVGGERTDRGLVAAPPLHPNQAAGSPARGRSCASAGSAARGRTAGLDATPPLQHVQAAGSTARGRTWALRCTANAKDFNKAGEIHCKAFVSTSQDASLEISKLPKTHPKTWINSARVISVALWGSIGDEHDTNDTTVKYRRTRHQ